MSSVAHAPESTELIDAFEEFYRNYYADDIAALAQSYPKDQQSLYVEAEDVYQFDPHLLDDWRDKPSRIQPFAEEALRLYDLPVDISLDGARVRLTDTEGTLERRSVAQLSADDIGEFVALSGQLARITGKSPRLVTACYECQRCGTPHNIPQHRNETQEPHECQSCERQGPFVLKSDQSEWVDQRKIKLEEPIEERSQPRGQSVAVYVEGDLVDDGPGETMLPDHAGEHATVLGTVRVNESKLSGRNASPESDLWIDAQAIVFDADAAEDIDIETHREEFETLAAREDAVDLVAESLAPSLHADPDDDLYTVRRACAAWLFNAYRLDPEGGESKRGDLHMALIGDPGTGKSTLMKYLHDVLPKSEFRSGTGLSKVGLTAAAVQEEFAGTTEWTLQPGILPRADGGHCLIDEVDGVIDERTKAIHDALEGEQMVKADKAGIKADLPTRTALLVGGNPTYTRFDKFEPISEQIDLDPALFDRMDLVFALEDEVDEARDETKAAHTLDAWDSLSRADAGDDSESEATDAPVSKETLRAWIAFAREHVFPTLTPDAKQALKSHYVEVRDLNGGYSREDEAAVPATMRTLEASIRLSIAFARLRLSETVEREDAERAIGLSKEAVGLRFDPETGEFDEARSTSGMPKSQRDRIQRIRDIVAELDREFDEPGAPRDAVLDRIEEMGVSRSKAEHEIAELCKKGELMEPTTNHYRVT